MKARSDYLNNFASFLNKSSDKSGFDDVNTIRKNLNLTWTE